MITLTDAEARALRVFLATMLAPVIRADWGETDQMVRLLRRLEREGRS